MRTVMGVLPSVTEATRVAHQFEEMGIARNEINVVQAAADEKELKKVEHSRRSNAMAARSGLGRGAVLGLVLSSFMMSTPGVHPFVAGSAAATLAVACVVVACLMCAMVVVSNMGQMHEEAALFEEAVHEKGVVVAAHVSEASEAAALQLFGSNGARDVHAASDVSHLSRWTARFRNPNPYPCDSQAAAHLL